MTLDDIDITNNLVWVDEFTYNNVEQSKERSLTGGLIVQAGLKLFGRPITLSESWLPRSTIDALAAKEMLSEPMILTLADSRVFTVVFDRSRGIAIEATPVHNFVDAANEPAWQYRATIRLMTVEPTPEPVEEE